MKTSNAILLLLSVIAATCFAQVCEDTSGKFEINRDDPANPGQKLLRGCGVWLAANMDRINRCCGRADVKVTCPFNCCESRGNCVLPTPSPSKIPTSAPSKGKGKGGKGGKGTLRL